MSSINVTRASEAWLVSVRADEAPDGWIEDLATGWMMKDEMASMWTFVLSLCASVSDDETEVIEMIGAGPLWAMVDRWPLDGLDLIEAEVEDNQRLRAAARILITSNPAIARRVERLRESR